MKKLLLFFIVFLSSLYSWDWSDIIPPPDFDASDGFINDVSLINLFPDGSTACVIARATSPSGEKKILHTFVTSQPYHDETAVPGVQYYYFAKAFYPVAGVLSSYSDPEPGYRRFAPPSNVSATDGTDIYKVTLTFDRVEGDVQYYEIYRALYLTDKPTKLGQTTAISYSDTTANQGTTYYYFVKACNDTTGCSEYSSYDAGYKAQMVPLISASDGSYTDRVVISDYTPFTGAEYFKIYRATSETGTKTELASYVTSPTFDDTTAVSGTTYYYFVQACNELGCSDYSSYDTGLKGSSGALPAPTNISATDGEYADWVYVTNYSVEGAERYYVYYATTPTGTKNEIYSTTQTSGMSFRIGLSGVVYYFFVRAYNSEQGYSDYSVYDTGYRAFLPSPTNVTASDGTFLDRVEISFDGTEEATSYEIYRSSGSPDNYRSRIATGVTTTSYVNTSGLPGVTYYYFVKAVNSVGSTSDFSDYDTGFIGEDTTPPSGYSVTFDDLVINGENMDSTGFTFSSAEVGAEYWYTISSNRGDEKIQGSGTIFDSEQYIQLPTLLGLMDGTLTLDVKLRDQDGNWGESVTANATLDLVTEEIIVTAEGTVTSEDGDDNPEHVASIIVSLSSEPSDDVNLTLSCSDSTEGDFLLAPSESTLITFNASNWNFYKPIRVAGLDDEEKDGDVFYQIIIESQSNDPYYDSKRIVVDLTNLDNDTPKMNPAIIMYLLN